MTLRLLIDACCSPRLAALLAAQGHDVVRMADLGGSASDDRVAVIAEANRRILVTDDKGFGERAVFRGQVPDGAVLIRIRRTDMTSEAADERVATVIAESGEALAGHMTVVEAYKVRPRPLTRLTARSSRAEDL